MRKLLHVIVPLFLSMSLGYFGCSNEKQTQERYNYERAKVSDSEDAKQKPDTVIKIAAKKSLKTNIKSDEIKLAVSHDEEAEEAISIKRLGSFLNEEDLVNYLIARIQKRIASKNRGQNFNESVIDSALLDELNDMILGMRADPIKPGTGLQDPPHPIPKPHIMEHPLLDHTEEYSEPAQDQQDVYPDCADQGWAEGCTTPNLPTPTIPASPTITTPVAMPVTPTGMPDIEAIRSRVQQRIRANLSTPSIPTSSVQENTSSRDAGIVPPASATTGSAIAGTAQQLSNGALNIEEIRQRLQEQIGK